ncbi:hypothetical protein [Mycoplasma procyoni]|uniref:hypothetical protein n=1 Tax=Mycoplasma procyoni TaxID=568784 RepID=UPI00197C2A02|nr:hypothetical protein [Mycoplasma procyoni]MBN3535089.1 hypothetical protein [Mycoplasma procyoni]
MKNNTNLFYELKQEVEKETEISNSKDNIILTQESKEEIFKNTDFWKELKNTITIEEERNKASKYWTNVYFALKDSIKHSKKERKNNYLVYILFGFVGLTISVPVFPSLGKKQEISLFYKSWYFFITAL